jgi:eukaryotic-like serine/threonine-protein kinase
MKKNHIIMILGLLGLSLILSGCVQGPRTTGAPGIAISDELVFVANGSFLYAINAETRAVEWSFPESRDTKIVFFAPPLVMDGFVYVGDLANNFYKIDIETHEAVWTFSEAKGFFVGQAALADDVIYAPSNDGNLYAIDQNGSLMWTFETGHYIWSQPQISESAIFVASMDQFVYAVSKSGQELWRTELAGAVNASPVLSEDGSVLFVGSLGKEMVALDTASGVPVWTFTFDGDLESVWGRAVLNEGTLYFADSGGLLYALDAGSGQLVWPAPIEFPGSVVGGLTTLEDGFVFATEEGDIRAYNFDGTMKWERSVDGEIFQAPVVSDNYLVIGAIDGEELVYLYDLDGNRIWAETPEN